jgi:hypothetical protein
MSENIPLTILRRMNTIEKTYVSGNYKKEKVLESIIIDNIDIEKLINDLIEMLIDISRKKIKILINSSKKCF